MRRSNHLSINGEPFMTGEDNSHLFWYARAKLMITGEYLVLRGARSLAVPLKFGQSLQVSFETKEPVLQWSAEIPGQSWFSARYNVNTLEPEETSNADMAERLRLILETAREMNPLFLSDGKGLNVKTVLNFPPEWGIGSSSSLIANISRWAMVDPYELNRRIFRGSGYDIAAALSPQPVLYQLNNGAPHAEMCDFRPPLPQNIWVVYLNRKEDSRSAVIQFQNTLVLEKTVDAISEITAQIVRTREFHLFCNLLQQHEEIISGVLHQIPAGKLKFPDFEGTIKSLGAWGGDFILAATIRREEFVRNYFSAKGYNTLFRLTDLLV